MGQLPQLSECRHPYFIHALLSVHCAFLSTWEALKGRFSWLLFIYSCTPFSSLWTVKMEIWKANCYFYVLENKAHTGNNFWGNSNRQKLSERMHQAPSCFKCFQMLARCPYPYITEWIKAQFCMLDIKSLADILYIMQRFNIHLEIPPRNGSEWCSLQVHTGCLPFIFHYLVLSLRITSWKLWRIFQMCIFIRLSLPSSRSYSFCVRSRFILERMGGKNFCQHVQKGNWPL